MASDILLQRGSSQSDPDQIHFHVPQGHDCKTLPAPCDWAQLHDGGASNASQYFLKGCLYDLLLRKACFRWAPVQPELRKLNWVKQRAAEVRMRRCGLHSTSTSLSFANFTCHLKSKESREGGMICDLMGGGGGVQESCSELFHAKHGGLQKGNDASGHSSRHHESRNYISLRKHSVNWKVLIIHPSSVPTSSCTQGCRKRIINV